MLSWTASVVGWAAASLLFLFHHRHRRLRSRSFLCVACVIFLVLSFFGDLSFAELERRTVPAPYIPNISSPFDASQFDDYDEDEDDEDLGEEERELRAHWESFNTDATLFNGF